jgi:hypothetical protein
MRLCAVGGLAAVLVGAGAACAQERLVLEHYPVDSASNAPWQVVTDKDLGGRFYVELMPADQTPSNYRDILAAASFPHVRASPAEFLQGMTKQFEQGQQCEGLTLNPPRSSREQGWNVAYAQAYCGQEGGQSFGVQIFYKAIQGDDSVYVVSRDFRVPPSKVGGDLAFSEGQQDQALALMKAVGAANAWLASSVYLCGPSTKDLRCSRPAPSGANVLVSGGELDTLAKSAPYQTLITKAVAALPPEVTKGCPAVGAGRSSILVLKPISFAQNGLPFEGAWKQSFAQAGCAAATRLNFLFTATPDQRIRTLILAPGDGIADPQVQAQAFRSAVASVQGAAAQCQALHVLDTRFEAFDHSKASGPDPAPGAKVEIPWRETWTLGGCGAAWTVPMLFTPDSAATQVAAGKAMAKP